MKSTHPKELGLELELERVQELEKVLELELE